MVPVCRDKEYLDLLRCDILKIVLYRDKNRLHVDKTDRTAEFHTSILDTIEILKPTRWYYELTNKDLNPGFRSISSPEFPNNHIRTIQQ